MYNSASQEFDSTYPVNIIVTDNGGCNHVPPGIFQSTCKVILTSYINDFGDLMAMNLNFRRVFGPAILLCVPPLSSERNEI